MSKSRFIWEPGDIEIKPRDEEKDKEKKKTSEPEQTDQNNDEQP